MGEGSSEVAWQLVLSGSTRPAGAELTVGTAVPSFTTGVGGHLSPLGDSEDLLGLFDLLLGGGLCSAWTSAVTVIVLTSGVEVGNCTAWSFSTETRGANRLPDVFALEDFAILGALAGCGFSWGETFFFARLTTAEKAGEGSPLPFLIWSILLAIPKLTR